MNRDGGIRIAIEGNRTFETNSLKKYYVILENDMITALTITTRISALKI